MNTDVSEVGDLIAMYGVEAVLLEIQALFSESAEDDEQKRIAGCIAVAVHLIDGKKDPSKVYVPLLP